MIIEKPNRFKRKNNLVKLYIKVKSINLTHIHTDYSERDIATEELKERVSDIIEKINQK